MEKRHPPTISEFLNRFGVNGNPSRHCTYSYVPLVWENGLFDCRVASNFTSAHERQTLPQDLKKGTLKRPEDSECINCKFELYRP